MRRGENICDALALAVLCMALRLTPAWILAPEATPDNSKQHG